MDLIRRTLTSLGAFTARPAAFLIVIAYGTAWLFLQPSSFDMHAIATLMVWIMTLVIQRAEHRDTQALHAKLDELVHAQSKARNDLTKIDDEEPEDIEERRQLERHND
ncbi:low affinity iron permease family protein [Mesorhizobium comanense]|uniref:low affinity iron permease family protein n=1 Tax=Mesorhizobium comanense TaxID=2502215 RepID=UPI001E4BA9B0|nr:low affinity iron permease family protein [Mesorhizobium comanense]